jgi:hypothetical protein
MAAPVPAEIRTNATVERFNYNILSVIVRLEKLILAQLVTTFPTFYATRRFITVFTRARQVRAID